MTLAALTKHLLARISSPRYAPFQTKSLTLACYLNLYARNSQELLTYRGRFGPTSK
jgi:hypothetical protein